jgi:hypothetical protein
VTFANLPPIVLIDANNVAFGQASHGPALLVNLERAIEDLKAAKVAFVPIADASLRHQIDRKEEFEGLLRVEAFRRWNTTLIQVEKGMSADRILIGVARLFLEQGRPSYILTRDRFLDHPDARGIPLIKYYPSADGPFRYEPPLNQLLSRVEYLSRYPEIILPDGAICPHPTFLLSRDGDTTLSRCELCGQVDPPMKFYEEFQEPE